MVSTIYTDEVSMKNRDSLPNRLAQTGSNSPLVPEIGDLLLPVLTGSEGKSVSVYLIWVASKK